eukprot:scaffold723_cov363-Prasinococcus_capsulatus_cf.AAC.2
MNAARSPRVTRVASRRHAGSPTERTRGAALGGGERARASTCARRGAQPGRTTTAPPPAARCLKRGTRRGTPRSSSSQRADAAQD